MSEWKSDKYGTAERIRVDIFILMIYDPHTGKIDTDYLIAELERTRAQRDKLAAACRGLIEYRSQHTLTFQLEKADDYIHTMRAVLEEMTQ